MFTVVKYIIIYNIYLIMKVCSNNKLDGFGSVYICCLCCLATCRQNGYVYRHKHFNDLPGMWLHHNPTKSNEYNFILNDFTGLISDASDNLTIEAHYGHGGGVQGGFPINDTNKYFNESILSEIRKMYYNTWKPQPIPCDVAIHIRRGDIARNHKIINGKKLYVSERAISIEYFKRKIVELQSKSTASLKFIIFSEGIVEDFKEILIDGYNITFYLNTELRETFHSMVKAPILVLSPSMMSIAAALLNTGEIHYYKWNAFNKLNHWNMDMDR